MHLLFLEGFGFFFFLLYIMRQSLITKPGDHGNLWSRADDASISELAEI